MATNHYPVFVGAGLFYLFKNRFYTEDDTLVMHAGMDTWLMEGLVLIYIASIAVIVSFGLNSMCSRCSYYRCQNMTTPKGTSERIVEAAIGFMLVSCFVGTWLQYGSMHKCLCTCEGPDCEPWKNSLSIELLRKLSEVSKCPDWKAVTMKVPQFVLTFLTALIAILLLMYSSFNPGGGDECCCGCGPEENPKNTVVKTVKQWRPADSGGGAKNTESGGKNPPGQGGNSSGTGGGDSGGGGNSSKTDDDNQGGADDKSSKTDDDDKNLCPEDQNSETQQNPEPQTTLESKSDPQASNKTPTAPPSGNETTGTKTPSTTSSTSTSTNSSPANQPPPVTPTPTPPEESTNKDTNESCPGSNTSNSTPGGTPTSSSTPNLPLCPDCGHRHTSSSPTRSSPGNTGQGIQNNARYGPKRNENLMNRSSCSCCNIIEGIFPQDDWDDDGNQLIESGSPSGSVRQRKGAQSQTGSPVQRGSKGNDNPNLSHGDFIDPSLSTEDSTRCNSPRRSPSTSSNASPRHPNRNRSSGTRSQTPIPSPSKDSSQGRKTSSRDSAKSQSTPSPARKGRNSKSQDASASNQTHTPVRPNQSSSTSSTPRKGGKRNLQDDLEAASDVVATPPRRSQRKAKPSNVMTPTNSKRSLTPKKPSGKSKKSGVKPKSKSRSKAKANFKKSDEYEKDKENEPLPEEEELEEEEVPNPTYKSRGRGGGKKKSRGGK